MAQPTPTSKFDVKAAVASLLEDVDAPSPTLPSQVELAERLLIQGRLAEAEAGFKELLSRPRMAQDSDRFRAVIGMALTFQLQGRPQQVEKLLCRVLPDFRAVLGSKHPDTLVSELALAAAVWMQGGASAAEDLLRATLVGMRQTFGDSHPDTLVALSILGSMLHSRGCLEEAEQTKRAVTTSLSRALGRTHAETLSSMSGLANLLRDRRKYAEAAALYKEMALALTDAQGNLREEGLNCTARWGIAAAQAGNRDEAREVLEEMLRDHLYEGHALAFTVSSVLRRLAQ